MNEKKLLILNPLQGNARDLNLVIIPKAVLCSQAVPVNYPPNGSLTSLVGATKISQP